MIGMVYIDLSKIEERTAIHDYVRDRLIPQLYDMGEDELVEKLERTVLGRGYEHIAAINEDAKFKLKRILEDNRPESGGYASTSILLYAIDSSEEYAEDAILKIRLPDNSLDLAALDVVLENSGGEIDGVELHEKVVARLGKEVDREKLFKRTKHYSRKPVWNVIFYADYKSGFSAHVEDSAISKRLHRVVHTLCKANDMLERLSQIRRERHNVEMGMASYHPILGYDMSMEEYMKRKKEVRRRLEELENSLD